MRLVICDRRSAHKSIWSGMSIICASRVPKIIIGWTESTIIPWLLAPIETKQIDWSFKESNINHLPRRNRVLLKRKKNSRIFQVILWITKKFYRRILTKIFAASKSKMRLIDETGRKCVSFVGGDLNEELEEIDLRSNWITYSTFQAHLARTRPRWEPSFSIFSRIICLAFGTISKIDSRRAISVTKSDPPVL